MYLTIDGKDINLTFPSDLLRSPLHKADYSTNESDYYKYFIYLLIIIAIIIAIYFVKSYFN